MRGALRGWGQGKALLCGCHAACQSALLLMLLPADTPLGCLQAGKATLASWCCQHGQAASAV